MTISETAVKKPTTTLLIFLVLIALGIYCTLKLPMDMFPNMEIPYMLVMTSYPNAGPEEVEQSVTRIMESSLSGLSGLKSLKSQSSAGQSLIILELDYGANLDSAANEIRDKIDLVRAYLPTNAEAPVTIRADPSMIPMMTLALKGKRTPEELRDYAENIVQPRLEQIDGVASANISGGREKSINVDIPRDRLEAYGLSISTVAQMIGAQNVQSSGGTITSGQTNYSIKTNGKYTSIDDLKNTVISYKAAESNGMSAPEIRTIRLRDVADIYEGYKTETSLAYLDGEQCVILNVTKQSGKNSVTAAKAIRSALGAIKKELPSDVDIIETSNTTDIIEQTIAEVVKSVVQGALLAVIVLFVFLRSFKSTIIIGLAIPISVFITLFLMYFMGITLNMISLGGLLLGIGMLVDNSIVVLENIFSYTQKGSKPTVAAVMGSREMIMSITASTLTSVCIFLPMLMFKKQLGIMGQFFNDLAYTIIFSLLCSLIVAIALVPVLTSKYLKIENVAAGRRKGIGYGISNLFDALFRHLEKAYSRGVAFVIRFRYICIALVFLLLIGSFLSVKVLGFIFMPESASSTVSVQFELPKGTTLGVTDATVREFEATVMPDLKGIKYTSISVGGSSMLSSGAETNTGTITFSIYPEDERQPDWDSEQTLKAKLRKYFNRYPGTKITFQSNNMSMSSGGISIGVRSNDLELLRSTSAQIVKVLNDKGSEYVTEVTSDQEEGLPQVEIFVDRDRMYEMGLNIYNVGSEIAAAINGTTASRYTKNGDDIDVVVRLSEQDKNKLSDLDQIFAMNNSGVRVPLSSFSHYVQDTAPVTINRENQSRIIHITVKPVSGLSLDVVQAGVQKIIDDNIPKNEAVTLSFSGDYEDMVEAVVNFGAIIIMAAVLVFVVMASQFESFLDPFIILATIPLSLIGVIAIYFLAGQQLSIITVMGILVLVGTIVNNGIVLVDYTNLLRKRGLELREACVEAARSRLRPILMSTLTTVISLAPMAFFPGEGSTSMQPISLTVFGGMSFGSLMTLFIMPAIYFIVNNRRLKKAERKRQKAEKKRREQEARESVFSDSEMQKPIVISNQKEAAHV